MDVNAQAISSTNQNDQVQTKYYCKIEKQQKVQVLMELEAIDLNVTSRLPLRYVLVIDVSGSMEQTVGSDKRTLLERVKLFAELVIRKIKNQDSLAIVSFASDVRIDLPMTQMTSESKETAKETIRCLGLRGRTNLEIGLMAALQTISDSQTQRVQESRDCIILFTDGAANEGITDSVPLIQKYRERQISMNKKSCIPVSAFTIGSYHPNLLIQISRHLGSESFYWLNDAEDFEANMLLPLFLREITNVSDVRVTFHALDGAQFTTNEFSSTLPFTNCGNEELRFFIHSLPSSFKKHIPVTIILAPNMQIMDGQRIMNITVNYLDLKLHPRQINDFVLLFTSSLLEIRNNDPSTRQKIKSGPMNDVAAFTITRNEVSASWSDAKKSIAMIAEEDCKLLSIQAMSEATYFIGESNAKAASKAIKNRMDSIDSIRTMSINLFGDDKGSAELNSTLQNWKTKLGFSKQLVAASDESKFSRISAMVSSLSTESPAGFGVFNQEQPYLVPDVEEKLEMAKTDYKLKFQKSHARGEDVLVKDVTEVLRELEIAKNDKVFENELRKIEKIILGKITTENTQLLVNLITQLQTQVKQKTEKSIQDKKAMYILDESKIALKRMIRKREITEELAYLRPLLLVDLTVSNFPSFKDTVERMQVATRKANEFGGLLSKNDISLLEKAQVNLEKMVKLYQTLKELSETSLSLQALPENLEKLSSAVQGMTVARNEAVLFQGFFNTQHEKILNDGNAKVRQLTQQRESIRAELQRLIPQLNNCSGREDISAMKTSIERAIVLKEHGRRYENLLSDDVLRKIGDLEKLLQEEKGDVKEELQKVIEDLKSKDILHDYVRLEGRIGNLGRIREKARNYGIYTNEHENLLRISQEKLHSLGATLNDINSRKASVKISLTLPMIPNNLETIQSAVTVMDNIKEESIGIKGAFTEEDHNLYNEAFDGVRILEKKVQKRNSALQRLEAAMENRKFDELSSALKRAKKAPFTGKNELKEAKRLVAFINPKIRRSALKAAIKEEDTAMLESEIADFEEAGVSDDALFEKANKVLKKLRKRDRRLQKEQRKQERVEERKQAEIKRLSSLLQLAMESNNIDELDEAVEEFENNKYKITLQDVPIAKEAMRLLEEMQIEELRKRLVKATRKRSYKMLNDAIMDVDYKGCSQHMLEEYNKARELLIYLREMIRLRDEIAQMSRSTISEIHKYPTPPQAVHKIMMATYLLLGEPHKELKNWNTIQILLGKLDRTSVMKRVKRFEMENLNEGSSNQAEKLITDMDLDEVKEISQVAAIFFAWARYVVNEYKQQEEDENDSNDSSDSEEESDYSEQ